jgi:hypothetical protein
MASLTAGRAPVRFTSLVGRERELRDVLQRLESSRLLTLTGPGGTGKTRLALAAAQAADGLFPGRVCWAELAPAGDPGIVAQTVASQLGVPDMPGLDAAEAIAGHVSGRPVLIVLDNCEHLAAAVAGLTEQLLAACPALSILATSREPLGVEGNAAGRSRRCPCLRRRPGTGPLPGPRPLPRWPPRTRCGSSNKGRSSCGPRSGSATTTPPPSCTSATAWTACHWR